MLVTPCGVVVLKPMDFVLNVGVIVVKGVQLFA